jgi:hypothetical protein
MSKIETYDRARLAILTRIIQKSTVKRHGTGRDSMMDSGILKGFTDETPQPGDLVRMEYITRPTKWYLSWFVENAGDQAYLLESIEDRERRKWSNCCVSVYDREVMAKNGHFRFNDRQFAFWDRWKKPIGRYEPFMVMTVMPHFEGQRVRLATRSRENAYPRASQEMWFDNWAKVTKKQMREFYLSVLESLKPVDRATLPTEES